MGAYDAEIRSYYEKFVYGKWRSGETVSYKVMEESLRLTQPETQTSPITKLPLYDNGKDVILRVTNSRGRDTIFTVRAYIPAAQTKRENGFPFIVCMHPIAPKQFALDNGYALIFIDSVAIASDDTSHVGAFYDLYPYGKDPESQTGVLMAWAWGASKVLDAVYAGLGKEFDLDESASIVTGVSRWGKATAVCGAFDSRFKVVAPACSGAGGLALWRYVSTGMTYDLSKFGGPEDYVYGQNEPLSSLQADGERGWFVDKFMEFRTPDEILTDQYYLPVLSIAKDRLYFIIAAWMGEDWVNAPAMWECYKKAQFIYSQMGIADRIIPCFHKEGHAVLEEDLKMLFEILK